MSTLTRSIPKRLLACLFAMVAFSVHAEVGGDVANTEHERILEALTGNPSVCFGGQCKPLSEVKRAAKQRTTVRDPMRESSGRSESDSEICVQGKCSAGPPTFGIGAALPGQRPGVAEGDGRETIVSEVKTNCRAPECFRTLGPSDITLRTALDQLAASTGFAYEVEPEKWGSLPVGAHPPATARQRTIKELLDGLAYYTIADGEKRLTITIIGTVGEVLPAALRQNSAAARTAEPALPPTSKEPPTFQPLSEQRRVLDAREVCFEGRCYDYDLSTGVMAPTATTASDVKRSR